MRFDFKGVPEGEPNAPIIAESDDTNFFDET
jgi:hypothetical protein